MKRYRRGDPAPDGGLLFRKRTEVRMWRQSEPFECESREGVLRGEAGDWLAEDGHGGFYPISSQFHADNYEKALERVRFVEETVEGTFVDAPAGDLGPELDFAGIDPVKTYTIKLQCNRCGETLSRHGIPGPILTFRAAALADIHREECEAW